MATPRRTLSSANREFTRQERWKHSGKQHYKPLSPKILAVLKIAQNKNFGFYF